MRGSRAKSLPEAQLVSARRSKHRRYDDESAPFRLADVGRRAYQRAKAEVGQRRVAKIVKAVDRQRVRVRQALGWQEQLAIVRHYDRDVLQRKQGEMLPYDELRWVARLDLPLSVVRDAFGVIVREERQSGGRS